jgi:hypothetical protein
MKTKKASVDIPLFITCELCKERFADEETLEAHQRSELGRLQPSNRFLSYPKLAKCYSKEALWAQNWRSTKYGKTLHIWTRPPMPKLRAHRMSEDAYQCLACNKVFACSAGFKAHHVMTFTPNERCLDSDELGALSFERSASGIYRISLITQYLPSQIARLPTVRAEIAALAAFESAQHALANEAPINLRLDPTDTPTESAKPVVKATLPSPSVAKGMFTSLADDLIAAASAV